MYSRIKNDDTAREKIESLRRAKLAQISTIIADLNNSRYMSGSSETIFDPRREVHAFATWNKQPPPAPKEIYEDTKTIDISAVTKDFALVPSL